MACLRFETTIKKGGTLAIPFPSDVASTVVRSSAAIGNPVLFFDASQLDAVLSAVRDTVLQWTLRLKEDGILGDDLTFSSEEKNTASQQDYNVVMFTGQVINPNIQQSSGAYGSLTVSRMDLRS